MSFPLRYSILIKVFILVFTFFSAYIAGAIDIYRSVGPGNTLALATGVGNELSVSGSIATFSQALPNYIGVGDVLQYDSTNDGLVNVIAFIHGRIDSNHFTIKAATGIDPIATSIPDHDWAIFRAYTSLSDAEAGVENSGINIGLRDFDSWIGGYDVLANDHIWYFTCYGDAIDTTTVVFDGWTTGPNNYIKIYTPHLTSEVGTSQRHHGKWTTTAYRLEIPTGNGILTLSPNHMRIEGIQIRLFQLSSNGQAARFESPGASVDIRFSKNILRGVSNTTFAWHAAIAIHQAGAGTARIWNNLFYDFNGTNTCVAYDLDDSGFTYYVYNNTVDNCWNGYWRELGNFIAKNNIAQNCVDGFRGGFNGASNYNISDLAGDAPGAQSKNSTTVDFVNEASDDFHLSAGDTAAQDAGIDLSLDGGLAFSDDIDHQIRITAWDIGADEMIIPPTPTATPTITGTPTVTATPTLVIASPTSSATLTPVLIAPLLSQLTVYPNPFKTGSQQVTIQYVLNSDADVTITIFNYLGSRIREFQFRAGQSGGRGSPFGMTNQFTWDGRNGQGLLQASGGFICQVIAKGNHDNTQEKATIKIGLIR